MIGIKNGVGYLNHKGVLKWLESIHKDTLEYGNEDQQFVLEQMICLKEVFAYLPVQN